MVVEFILEDMLGSVQNSYQGHLIKENEVY